MQGHCLQNNIFVNKNKKKICQHLMMLIWLFSCCYRSTKKAVCSAGRMVGGGGSNSSKIFRGETDGKEKNFILIFMSVIPNKFW